MVIDWDHYPDWVSHVIRAANSEQKPESLIVNERMRELERQRDEARAEVERLRKAVEDWHDTAVRAEHNAAMSQEETLSHINRIAALMDEAERLRSLLAEAVDAIEEWASYAGEYFRDKYGLPDELARFRSAIDAAMREGE